MGNTRRQRRSAQQWSELLNRFEASGLGVAAFCREEAIAESSFHRWRGLLGRNEAARPSRPATFVDLGPLRCEEPDAVSRWELRLDLGRGVVLTLVRG